MAIAVTFISRPAHQVVIASLIKGHTVHLIMNVSGEKPRRLGISIADENNETMKNVIEILLFLLQPSSPFLEKGLEEPGSLLSRNKPRAYFGLNPLGWP